MSVDSIPDTVPAGPAAPPVPGKIPRRHDLDALRAIAMLLGIVLHAGLSFTTAWWIVRDVSQHVAYDIAFSAIHGFRMPLFFLISGFFTAMLWRKRGLGRLVRHRFMRIFLPLMLCLVTIVPLVIGVSIGAMTTAGDGATGPGADWVPAVRSGDMKAFKEHLAAGMDVNLADPATGMPPLMYACLFGETELAALLLDEGAEVNARNRDGNTALHSAAFLGRVPSVELLLERGANPEVRGNDRSRPIESAQASWEITMWIAGLLKMEIDREEVLTGREQVLGLLRGTENGGAEKPLAKVEDQKRDRGADKGGSLWASLSQGGFWAHLWFLWFLCWLVAGFALYAILMDLLKLAHLPRWLIFAPGCLLWLLPLTLLTQLQMVEPAFGPDTSAGFLPKRHVLLYYAIFFMFGAFYWDIKDTEGRFGRWWIPTLLVTMLVIFPLGLDLLHGGEMFGFLLERVPAGYHKLVVGSLQVLFTWGMCFGCMGLFRALFAKENKAMRYISDSSYWLYIAHLPLVLLGQWVMRSWPVPHLVKFVLLTALISVFLLWTYEKLVRYSWLGTLLNGKRTRPATEPAVPTAPISS